MNTIRSLVAPQHWKHCPGKENPADIPSRGMSASDLVESPLRLHGQEWLYCSDELQEESTPIQPLSEECKREMKQRDAAHLLVNVQVPSTCQLSRIIDPEWYSSAYRPFRVTALVLSFICRLCECSAHPTPDPLPQVNNFEQARFCWIKDCQSCLQGDSPFLSWKHHLDLFMDGSGVWRCGGRMSKSCLLSPAKNPILLDKSHYLTRLIVTDTHLRVLHTGVKETLHSTLVSVLAGQGASVCSEDNPLLRCSARGRRASLVVATPCHLYRTIESSNPGHSKSLELTLQVPSFTKTSDTTGTSKVWLCLYTCCTSRAVHLDLVIDMTTDTFIRSFRRFASNEVCRPE